MEENQETTAPAAEQGAAQPEATGTAPAKSAAETKLEGQLATLQTKSDGYKKERDAARKDLAAANKELGTLRDENAQLKREKAEAAKASTTEATAEQPAGEPQKPSEEEVIKDVLKRNGLKKAWVLPSGPCFNEAHAREFAGADFDSLTVISVEEDAGTN